MTRVLQVFFVWLTLATAVAALGGNNVFGVLRKRRRSVEKIQEKRVQVASRKGFAGPNGERLSMEEVQALQQKMKPGVLGQFRNAISDRIFKS